jgi:hypothetical protein
MLLLRAITYAVLTKVLCRSSGIVMISILVYKKLRFSASTFIFDCYKCNGVTVPLRNYLLFLVTSNDFVTFKRAVTNNCNGTVTRKN